MVYGVIQYAKSVCMYAQLFHLYFGIISQSACRQISNPIAVCCVNDTPQKGGGVNMVPAPAFDLTNSLQEDFLLLSYWG